MVIFDQYSNGYDEIYRQQMYTNMPIKERIQSTKPTPGPANLFLPVVHHVPPAISAITPIAAEV